MKTLCAVCAFFCFSQIAALPEGFRLVGGDAKIAAADELSMTLEIGKSAIIEWQKFSVESDEAVRFLHQEPGSSVLNRVDGGGESEILGMLTSNGEVCLSNPEGLLVGPNARIVAAGFIGSGLDALRGDERRFGGQGTGLAVNKGSIIGFAGDVVLIGKEARNEGRIEAPQGLAGLAAGTEVLLMPAGQERIFVRPAAQMFAEADNRGLLKGLSIELKSGAAIRNSGMAEAYSTGDGGRISLCTEQGDIEISGGLRGERSISVIGQAVHIWGDARLDASGERGGGMISVSAFDIDVEEGAFLNADALGEGEGGRVILRAENENRFFGSISAQPGGFAEVSGGNCQKSFIINGL